MAAAEELVSRISVECLQKIISETPHLILGRKRRKIHPPTDPQLTLRHHRDVQIPPYLIPSSHLHQRPFGLFRRRLQPCAVERRSAAESAA
jgi:hypothetical protein